MKKRSSTEVANNFYFLFLESHGKRERIEDAFIHAPDVK